VSAPPVRSRRVSKALPSRSEKLTYALFEGRVL